jgi:probable H4MPT-linked C1 transfer pathway protein
MSTIVGLDVGGAHLKVAVTQGGSVLSVEQIACPLWQGLVHLDTALTSARPMLADARTIAITMTGELSDLFTDRRHGVETLVQKLDGNFGESARFWMGSRGFGQASDAINGFRHVASTNFLATATLVAMYKPEALLIDMGSTTTDVVAIRSGRPGATGLTDAERLATGELVYTGLTRTAVMGVATSAAFRGHPQGLCREYLATMADVRRILGDLPDNADQHATADGRGKSVDESIARLARMFGRDADDGTFEDWRQAAAEIAAIQRDSVANGINGVLANSNLGTDAPCVLAGIGAGVLADIAARLSRPAVTFGEMIGAHGEAAIKATSSAPAVAVALLAEP